jgi:hypothetical protein
VAGATPPSFAPAAEGFAALVTVLLLGGLLVLRALRRRHARTFVAPYRRAGAEAAAASPPNPAARPSAGDPRS